VLQIRYNAECGTRFLFYFSLKGLFLANFFAKRYIKSVIMHLLRKFSTLGLVWKKENMKSFQKYLYFITILW